MNNEAQNIAKQIQELENLANEMLDANNSDYEIFEQIYQQIEKLESQRNKILDEEKYLEEFQIMALYEEKGGKEKMAFANGISGKQPSLDDHFNDFLTGNDQSQVIFICENKHWLTVRLEKTEGEMIYQVADSMPENPTNDKSNREERIDALLGDICRKIPFKSETQQNGYDCGIYCALNAIDMKTNLIDGVKYSNAKSTYLKHDVETIREHFEKEKNNQQKPQQKEYEKSSSRLSSASTSSSLSSASSNYSNRSNLPQLKNSQLQRPLSASLFGSNVSMKPHQRQLKRQASEILINKGSSNSRYF